MGTGQRGGWGLACKHLLSSQLFCKKSQIVRMVTISLYIKKKLPRCLKYTTQSRLSAQIDQRHPFRGQNMRQYDRSIILVDTEHT